MNAMLFESRHLKPHAEPILASDLKEGTVYFFLSYADEEMRLPNLEPMVFIGRDLDANDSGVIYFQDLDSYRLGIRHNSTGGEEAAFYSGSEQDISHVFDYDHALDELMRCALRRGSQ